MEIIKANSASLCNHEVMQHLQKLRDDRKKNKGQGQLATITYETLRYLENAPCSQQSPESIRKCLKDLEPLNLHKNEKLMIINTPPATALEVQLLIEESEERLSENQVQQLVNIVTDNFPFVKKPETEEPDDVENEENT